MSAAHEPTRSYTTLESRALRAAFGLDPVTDGPAQFACGPHWPDELERRAAQFERLIPKLRLAAEALRREIANDARCTGPSDA